MLSAEAYSFRQKSRLAISLSWIGGYTNVVALLATAHFVSHMTGNTTSFGTAVAQQNWPQVRIFGFLLVCFLAGAIFSALLTEGARRRGIRSKYILPMVVEAVLLACFSMGIDYAHVASARSQWNLYAMIAAGAFAMGLQNATITKISGAIVRTTHLTGVLTDLGLEGVQFLLWYRDRMRSLRARRLGRVLKVTQRHPTFLRVLLLASIFGSFLFGVVAGALVYGHWPTYSLVAPISFLAWIVFVDWRHPIADVRELDLLSDPEMKMYGIVKSLLPPGVGIYRLATNVTDRSHRAPNFQLWVERLPRHWKTVILALSPLTRFDANSAMDLEAAARRLQSRGRTLILAGLTVAQYKLLDSLNVVKTLDAENVCPDLEFAIARAITLIESQQKASRSADFAI